MGEEIITRVHVLTEKEGRSRVINNFNFEWRPGTTIKELHSEGTSEDPLLASEPTEESEDPDGEHTQQGEEQIKDRGPTIQEDDEGKELFGLPQSTEEVSIQHEDVEPEESELDVGPMTKPDKEECGKEDSLDVISL